MKTLLLITCLLPTLLFSQITNHFSHQDSKWNVAKSYTAATQEHPSFVATTTKVYGYQGDSLINGETWSKIYSTRDSLFQNNLVYEGLTRVDNDLVLFKGSANTVDTLYDFNLAVGDSIEYDLHGSQQWLVVNAIHNIQINGQSYKTFTFEEPDLFGFFQLNEIWIEGIGSIHGPLFPNSPTTFSQEIPDSMLLTCSFSNNQQEWVNPDYSDCYVDITLGLKNQESLNFNIYPNPASSILTIESDQNISGDIVIYDVNGKLIQSINADGKEIKIDVSGWENGIYFLNFEVGEQKVLKRFIVGNE